MSSNDPFLGVYLKLDRASHHINDFKRIVDQWVKANARSVRAKNKKKPTTWGTKLPRHAPTILGDALHNMRAALDHAYCTLVEANGGKINSYTKFPIREDRHGCASMIKGQKLGSTPSNAVCDFILNNIQPYGGGKGADLYGLHSLDISDKHTNIIAANSVIKNKVISTGPGGAKIFGGTFILNANNKFLEAAPGVDVKFEGNPETAFFIHFANGQPFEGDEIAPTLTSLHASTTIVVNSLKELA